MGNLIGLSSRHSGGCISITLSHMDFGRMVPISARIKSLFEDLICLISFWVAILFLSVKCKRSALEANGHEGLLLVSDIKHFKRIMILY